MHNRRKRRRLIRMRRPNLTREALETIPRWVELGARPVDIAAALGTSVGSLTAICCQRRISLRPTGQEVYAMLDSQQWNTLHAEAVRRGISIGQLVARLVACLIDRGLMRTLLEDDAARDAIN